MNHNEYIDSEIASIEQERHYFEIKPEKMREKGVMKRYCLALLACTVLFGSQVEGIIFKCPHCIEPIHMRMGTWECSRCGYENFNDPQITKCGICGEPKPRGRQLMISLQWGCPYCGYDNFETARYCGECGWCKEAESN